MVSFICDACGNTLKKNQVEKHYSTQCRSCSILSCIDCGVDFPGDAYASHTSCITEAEKYQGHLYQAKNKENKGETKQKEWIKQVQGATDSIKDPRLRSMLEKISEYSNVPRKRKKFENFCKNSVNVYDDKTLGALWEAFNAGNKKPEVVTNESNGKEEKETEKIDEDSESETEKNNKKEKKKKKRKIEDVDSETEDNDKKKKKKNKKSSIEDNEETNAIDENAEQQQQQQQGKFHWHKAIKTALKETEDHELPIKKLRKKVLAAYEGHGIDHRASNIEESRNMFEKKLKTYPKIKIVKNTVKLI